jgi:hypothetical protein
MRRQPWAMSLRLALLAVCQRLAAMPYTDLTTLKQYLSITSADDDALLTALIARAQTLIDTAAARTFEAAADSTRRFDAIRDVTGDGQMLFLDDDLCQVTTVINGDGTTIPAADYVTEPRRRPPYYALRLKPSAGLAWTYSGDAENAITVTGRWAYSPTAPADIAHACVRLAAHLYRQKDTQSAPLSSPHQSADGVLMLPAQLPADVAQMLIPYRRLVP